MTTNFNTGPMVSNMGSISQFGLLGTLTLITVSRGWGGGGERSSVVKHVLEMLLATSRLKKSQFYPSKFKDLSSSVKKLVQCCGPSLYNHGNLFRYTTY